jgi:metacaspase-1
MPRQKALLIGINYFGTEQQLNGCINDAANCRNFLVEDRGFSSDPSDMVIMTDAPENQGTPFWPSMDNMLKAIAWLVEGNDAGDSVWLSYSGHGGTSSQELPVNGVRD